MSRAQSSAFRQALLMLLLPVFVFLAFALWWSFSDLPVLIVALSLTFPIVLAIPGLILFGILATVFLAARLLDRKQRLRIGLVALLSLLFLWPIWQAKDYLRFAVCAPFYLPKIVAAHGAGLVSFPWKQTGWGGIGNTDRILIYDPQGRLKGQLGWRHDGGNARIAVYTEPFVGPFYMRTIFYD